MTTPWRERPTEERFALNPALAALILAQASAGYQQEVGEGMPFMLSYLVAPVVLHRETRSLLPHTVATSLASWLADNDLARAAIQSRTTALAPLAREGMLLGLQTGVLTLNGALLEVPRPGAVVPGANAPERYELLRAARLVGRMFARVGSAPTVFALWGVKP